jgi:polar amino acid transport system substrate-binding protein
MLPLIMIATLTSGCASDQRPVSLEPDARAVAPKPLGTQIGGAADEGTSEAENCGDPEVSLSPGALPPPGAMPPGSTMAAIERRGYLIAGVDQNTYLFGYRNAKNGDIEGFDIDMVRSVAKAIFGDPGKVQFKVINSAQRISSLQSGDVDIVARTMTINCARRADVNFSAVYYDAGQSILVAGRSNVHSLDDLGGKRVCATNGSTSIETVRKKTIRSNGSRPIPVSVDDWSDCLVLLQQNQVDAVSTDDTILAGMTEQDPTARIVGAPFTREPYGLAVQREDEDFVRFINAVLEQMRGDGQWQRIYDRWVGGRLPNHESQPTPKYSR